MPLADAFSRMGASLHARLANAAADIEPRIGVPVIYRRRPMGVLSGMADAQSSGPSVTAATVDLDPDTRKGAHVYVKTPDGDEHWEVLARLDDRDTGLTRLDLTEPPVL